MASDCIVCEYEDGYCEFCPASHALLTNCDPGDEHVDRRDIDRRTYRDQRSGMLVIPAAKWYADQADHAKTVRQLAEAQAHITELNEKLRWTTNELCGTINQLAYFRGKAAK